LCLEVLVSARSAGARIYNYTPVVGLLREDGRIIGVNVRSKLRGEQREVRGGQVVNATGPWLDRVAVLENHDAPPLLRTTQGTHLLVPRITKEHAVVVTSRRDQRVFFVLPWRGETLIGTTDKDYKDDPASVRVTPEEVDYLLGETGRIFPGSRLTEEEIIARFAGVRPLVNAPGEASSVSRETEIAEGPGGMLSVIGGKYTLHRFTAAQVVDRVIANLGKAPIRTVTDRTPLAGGEMKSLEDYLEREAPEASRQYDVPEKEVRRLIGIYGTRYTALLDRIRENRSLLVPIVAGEKETVAQIDYAVEEEMAVRLPDLLVRRTGLSLTRHRRDPGMLKVAVERMGRLLGWDSSRQEEEVRLYLEGLE
ncbi:MAG TPA: FAD-dependent oxidoreductase, partial [Nitrospiria bacterium]|nr:FAD-dependent oxidoreductase [Nitrospiria bacterium]